MKKFSDFVKEETLKPLQDKNEEIRNEISNILEEELTPNQVKKCWKQINLLIENEIEQEKGCNI